MRRISRHSCALLKPPGKGTFSHSLSWFFQNDKPPASAARLRKSRYCCRTKKSLLKLASLTGLDPLTASLLLIVMGKVVCGPSVQPTGLLKPMVRSEEHTS